jgi:hypothetical protein
VSNSDRPATYWAVTVSIDDDDDRLPSLGNGQLHNLYSSPDIVRQIKSRRMRWAGHVARMGKGRNVYRVLVGRPEEKRPLERQRRRWEDGIKTDPREIGWGCGVDSPGSG